MSKTPENMENVEELKGKEVENVQTDEKIESLNTISLSNRDIKNQKAQEARDARKLPPIPGFSPSLEQLNEWLLLLDDDMWSHLDLYLYRKWPKIVRQLTDPDNPKYIDIICKEHVDKGLIGYLQTEHGGGTYKFIINDKDSKTPAGNTKSIMEPAFKIDENDYPCKLDLRELDLNDKRNVGFINKLKAEGKMDSKGNVTSINTGTLSNPAELAGQMGQMFDRFMSMYAAMDKDKQATINKILGEGSNKSDSGIQQLLLEKLKQDDPGKQVDTLIKLMTLMIPKQDNSIFQLLLQQMQDAAKQQFEMLKLIMTQKTEQSIPVEKEDFIDKLVRYRTALPELFGGGAGNQSKPTMAETVVEGIKEIGLPAMGLISQFIQLKTGVKPIIPVTEDQAREFVKTNPSMEGVAGTPQQGQPQQNKVLPMPTQSKGPGQPQQLDPNNLTICQKLLMQTGGMLIQAIKSGMDGATIADNLEAASNNPMLMSVLGGNVYGILKAQGKDEILKAMESIPEFWDQTGKVYGREYMSKLVDDFLTDPPEDDDDNGENEDGNESVTK